MSDAEKLRLGDMAAAAGLTPAEFARQRIFTGSVVVKQTRQIDATAFRDLNRVGVNLNQLVRWVNAGGVNNPQAFVELATEGRAILDRINTILARSGEE